MVHFMDILQTMSNIASIAMKINDGRKRGESVRILFDEEDVDSDTINSLDEVRLIRESEDGRRSNIEP